MAVGRRRPDELESRTQMVSLFDILGPVMVGPSSSHTAGACRLGLMARAVLGGTAERARIQLHGSFAATGEGHGTQRAIVGGLIGLHPDDLRLREAFQEARAAADPGLPLPASATARELTSGQVRHGPIGLATNTFGCPLAASAWFRTRFAPTYRPTLSTAAIAAAMTVATAPYGISFCFMR